MAGLMRTLERNWREKWDEGERKRIVCDGERRYKLGEDVIETRDRGYTSITSEDQFAKFRQLAFPARDTIEIPPHFQTVVLKRKVL